jgi:Cu/Ag efflux protein CusF
MTRRDILGSLTLAATMVFAVSVQAAELTLPGEPELDEKVESFCDQEAPSDEPLAYGRIVAVDPKAGRITLDFQPILPALPEGGRRIFQVADAKSLKGLGPGDKVRFEVERDGRSYTVTRIENRN